MRKCRTERARQAVSRRIPVVAAVLGGLGLSAATAAGADWPQFRGADRDGKSSETGLLRQWPAEGPPRLWVVEGLGAGYASVCVAAGIVCTTGLEGETGYAYAYHEDGTPLWKVAYGPEWHGSVGGSRTTPACHDGRLYLVSGHGRVVCLDARTGGEQWAVDTATAFGARQITWGISESPLVDSDRVICTPGGPKATVVALDRHTGQTVWLCDQPDETSAYCSPILVRRGDRRLVVTLTATSLLGIDADTGALLWRHGHDGHSGIHAVSPVHEAGRLYITSGYGGQRGEMLELSADGTAVESRWRDSKLDCHHGGVIADGGCVYGASDRNSGGRWLCLDQKTGQVLAEIAGVGKGSVAWADGMLYGYGENGQVGLIRPSPADFRLVSSFAIAEGSGEHWAHPVVANGRLYIRHGSALVAYDVRAASGTDAQGDQAATAD